MAIINMKLGVLFLSVLSITSACNVGDFYNGLIAGFEANPTSIGPCGTDLLELSTSLMVLIQDGLDTMGEKSGAFTKFVEDVQAFSVLIGSLSENCPVENFYKSLSMILTESGRKQALHTYLANVADINYNMYNVLHCQKDYGACGESLGYVVKTLTGATLN